MKTEMTAEAAVSLLRLFAKAGIDVWLDGGWAVDASLGEQTRTHKDLDIILQVSDLPRLQQVLDALGFRRREGGTESNFVLADERGLEVDVHARARFCVIMWNASMPYVNIRRFRPLATAALATLLSLSVHAQRADPKQPVIVQPGAPGQPTRTLPSSTRATLPPTSRADVQFMQHMIMHHAQAVEMTALIDSHTENKDVRSLGARISRSQADEIKFMQRWLAARGEQTAPPTHDMPGHNMPGMDMSKHEMLMPGMLTAKQMDALKKAKGQEFDRLFLTGMIQHHNGALIMVKDLFDTAGSGQDAELFNFVTDVDTGQRAEIKIMQTMLGEKPEKE